MVDLLSICTGILGIFDILYSWGFLGPTTTWGNGRVSQSFWELENNSEGLKSLFCRIIWSEIQSYRKATCNLLVLTFIKKTSPTRDRTWNSQIRSQMLYQLSYRGLVKNWGIFCLFIFKIRSRGHEKGYEGHHRRKEQPWRPPRT